MNYETLLYEVTDGVAVIRLTRSEDVSGMVSLLASDRAAYVTGQSIGISGGFVMQ